jgi:UDPglucose 6-dehydrogenase
MNVSVIGTGYVGLVSGACFAEMGNKVTCVDIDAEKVARMRDGEVPIYEPGLEDVFHRNLREGRLQFTTEIADTLGSAAVFLALPTPSGEDGSADLSYVLGAAKQLGSHVRDYTVVVNKSTVPVGTAEKVRTVIANETQIDFDVVSNPEFLREGQAIQDFLRPERVVIGTRSERAARVMHELYAPFVRRNGRIITTDEVSAEMIKYAANGFLATKISFMNQLAGLCEATGADVNAVRAGMGSDSRIGDQFLYPGPGYGGSCFPKDVKALSATGNEHGVHLGIMDAVTEANERQKKVLPEKVLKHFGDDVSGKRIALWGLAFKDNTDDIRESPALTIIDVLTSRGAVIVAFDPQAGDNVARLYRGRNDVQLAPDQYTALEEADALVIATNWREFYSPDFARMKNLLKEPVVFDGRNLYELDDMRKAGFVYSSIGRVVVNGNE